MADFCRCKTEYTVTGLASHSVQLDLLAMDEHGKFFNVEVQTESSGAPPQRARYYTGAVDTGHFPKGEDYHTLFDTYVIFITKEDMLGKGLPIYHVRRMIDETGDAFNDGSYIIYVNGELANDHTALGRLVHDFSCLHSKDIYDKTFKECVKKLKETEEGIQTMCTVMEELRNEGRDTTLIEAIKNLKITQHWTNEQALTALNIDKSKWPRILALL